MNGKDVRLHAALLGRDRSVGIVVFALLVWGVAEELLSGTELSFAANFIPVLVTWLGALGLRDDLSRGHLDLVLSRGVTLPQLLLSRILLAGSAGLVFLVVLAVPLAGSLQSVSRVLAGLVVAVVYWAVAGTVLGVRLHHTGVVLLGIGGTALALVWIYSACPRLTGHLATEWPGALLTWVLQAGGDYFPAGQLTFLRNGNHWLGIELLRCCLAGLILSLGLRWANRVSLPAGG